MTYTILLAQKIAIEHNLGLDLLELTVITELKKLTSNTAWQNAAVKHTDGNLYFLFRLSYIIDLLPLVFINNNGIDAKTKALRRILVELEKKGFLIRADFNREKGGNYCHITSKSDILISDTITKNGNAPLPKVSTTITKSGNAPLPKMGMYTSTNISELKENNNNDDFPKNSKASKKQSELVTDEQDSFSITDEEKPTYQTKGKSSTLNEKKEKENSTVPPARDFSPPTANHSRQPNPQLFEELFDPKTNAGEITKALEQQGLGVLNLDETKVFLHLHSYENTAQLIKTKTGWSSHIAKVIRKLLGYGDEYIQKTFGKAKTTETHRKPIERI